MGAVLVTFASCNAACSPSEVRVVVSGTSKLLYEGATIKRSDSTPGDKNDSAPLGCGFDWLSIFAHLAVDTIRPGVDAAAQIAHFPESILLQQFDCLHAARTHLADGNDFLASVKLVEALRQLRQRNQMSANVGDLVFVLVAHIEQIEVVAVIETALEFFSLNFGNVHFACLLLAQKQKPTCRSF